MKPIRRALAGTAIALLMASSQPAKADWPVIDVTNLAQNIMTAARSLEEVNNQITQIQQFIQMLQNQARNLTSLPFSILAPLQTSMAQLDNLMSEAQSLGYTVTSLERQFQTLYPNYGAAGYAGNISQAGLLADANARWAASVATYQHTMSVESEIVQNIPTDQAELSSLVGQSQDAVGALQAIQSGNQLLALQSHQLSATQDLLASSARAQEAESMRQAEVENASQVEWNRFYGNGVGYTPTSVQVFGGSLP